MKKLESDAFVGNTGHFEVVIDFAGSDVLGVIKVVDITPAHLPAHRLCPGTCIFYCCEGFKGFFQWCSLPFQSCKVQSMVLSLAQLARKAWKA